MKVSIAKPQPYVSVVIPTYNREKILCDTILQVLVQNYPNFEIIVVDQTLNHDPETNQFLEINAQKITLIRLETPSLPVARNVGVGAARGDIIIFIDDDVVLDNSFIQNHIANYADPSIGCVSGRVIEDSVSTPNGDDIGRITRWGRVIGNKSAKVRKDIEWASGCNFSSPKQLILKVGGFDEAFAGNAIFEDVDFSFRLRSRGYRIVFDPEASLVHLAATRGGCNTRSIDRVNYYHWFIRNKTLFFLKNMPKKFLTLLVVLNFSRAIKIGILENKNFKDFVFLLKSMLEGIRVYKGRMNIYADLNRSSSN